MTVSNTVKDTEKAKEGHTQQKAREKEITISCSALCAKYVLSLLFDFFHFPSSSYFHLKNFYHAFKLLCLHTRRDKAAICI